MSCRTFERVLRVFLDELGQRNAADGENSERAIVFRFERKNCRPLPRFCSLSAW
jgi:hypothetical protein